MQLRTLCKRNFDNMSIDHYWIHLNKQVISFTKDVWEQLGELYNHPSLVRTPRCTYDLTLSKELLKTKVKNSWVSINYLPFHKNEVILNIVVEYNNEEIWR